jgi:ABC-type Fe3+ transport system permease subunit
LSWTLLKNSLLVSGLATLLASGFGFLAALCAAGLGPRWRSLLIVFAVAALALPPFVATNCWLHYLGHSGSWRPWLRLDIFSVGGAASILALLYWPIPMLAAFTAWRRLEAHQLESDMALSGSWLLRGLLLPLAASALAHAAILTFVLGLNNFAVPAILQVKALPAEMWIKFNTAFDVRGALLLSWPLVLAPLLLVFWFARRPIPWPHLQSVVSANLFRRQLGSRWFFSAAGTTLLLCLLSVGLPLYQLLSTPRTWTELSGALAAGKSAVWNSFWFAAASATLVIIIAFATIVQKSARSPAPSASCPSHRFDLFNPGTSFNHFVGLLLWFPFFIPGVLLGIGWIKLFNRPWAEAFCNGPGIVILAYVVRYVALGWNAVQHAVRTVDQDLVDAARLEGATRWQMLRHVDWPQIGARIAAAWYIVFLLCLWDVESLLMVVPPGGETLALRIFNLLHYGHNAQVNALCVTLLALALAPLASWQAFQFLRRSCRVLRGPSEGKQPPATRNTHHAPRTTHHAILLALLVLSISSCSPNHHDSALTSQIFSRVEIIGSRGAGVGQLNKPRSVAVDLEDNLYVVDMTGRVQKFSPAGKFLLSWQMPQTDLGKPKGMTRDREGNILVLEPHYSRVNHFSPEGKLLLQWGEHGTNFGQFSLPRALAVNSRREIFVSEYQGVERVQKFGFEKLSPRCIASYGRPGTGPGEFNRAEGLCMDAHDRLYVADSCNHRIQIFSGDGGFLRAYGKPGSGLGDLSYPYDICVDSVGRQYVCEFGNSRIQVFDGHDRPIEIIGGPGVEPGRFNNPWGVALDSAGNLYVADSQNHRVQKLIPRDSPGLSGK